MDRRCSCDVGVFLLLIRYPNEVLMDAPFLDGVFNDLLLFFFLILFCFGITAFMRIWTTWSLSR